MSNVVLVYVLPYYLYLVPSFINRVFYCVEDDTVRSRIWLITETCGDDDRKCVVFVLTKSNITEARATVIIIRLSYCEKYWLVLISFNSHTFRRLFYQLFGATSWIFAEASQPPCWASVLVPTNFHPVLFGTFGKNELVQCFVNNLQTFCSTLIVLFHQIGQGFSCH